jgi:hypothetical protein
MFRFSLTIIKYMYFCWGGDGRWDKLLNMIHTRYTQNKVSGNKQGIIRRVKKEERKIKEKVFFLLLCNGASSDRSILPLIRYSYSLHIHIQDQVNKTAPSNSGVSQKRDNNNNKSNNKEDA